jgi:hypothetical protein
MMNTPGTLFRREGAKAEALAALSHALDCTYRGICEAARRDWEHLFPAKEPADSCVTVRVSPVAAGATRGSGFLKSRQQKVSKTKGLPRFAH